MKRSKCGSEAYSLKEEVLRGLLMAQCLEPLAHKPGCTTRHVDSTPGTKLEYFTISAINSAWPLLDLVDRIESEGRQPALVFDAAYEAQRRSPRNRLGGKVNYAGIMMILPLIIGQCLLKIEGGDPFSVDQVVDRACEAMRTTSVKDVYFLQMFVDHSRNLSEAHHARLGTTRDQWRPQFNGRFKTIMDAMSADQFSHLIMSIELRNRYKFTRRVLNALATMRGIGLLKASEIVYPALKAELGRHDIAADCIVSAFYLAVSTQDTDGILFP